MGDRAVGLYSIAYKIFSPIAGLCAPFNRAVFPKLSQMFSREAQGSVYDYMHFAIRCRNGLLVVFSCVSLMLFLFAPFVIGLVTGERNADSIVVLRILSVALLFFPLGPFYTQLLVIEDLKKELLIVIVSVGLLNSMLLYPIILNYGVFGLAFLAVISLSIIGVANGYIVNKSWQNSDSLSIRQVSKQ